MARNQPETAQWCRFSRYEIKNGYIRPAPDAKFEPYDPVQAFRDNARNDEKGERQRAAWEELARVANELRVGAKGWELTPDGEFRLRTWCEKFGLLGTLLHRVETVVLPPLDEEPQSHFVYFPGPFGWTGAKLSGRPAPGVFIRGPHGVRFELLSATWGTYFPAVPETERDSFQYPHPSDEEFWRMYAEPVEEVLETVIKIKKWMTSFAENTTPEARANTENIQLRLAKTRLTEIIGGISPSISLNKQTFEWERKWFYPTLLSALGMSIIDELSGGQTLRICAFQNCKTIFASKSMRATFCSEACRQNAYHHRKRQQKPQHRAIAHTNGDE